MGLVQLHWLLLIVHQMRSFVLLNSWNLNPCDFFLLLLLDISVHYLQYFISIFIIYISVGTWSLRYQLFRKTQDHQLYTPCYLSGCFLKLWIQMRSNDQLKCVVKFYFQKLIFHSMFEISLSLEFFSLNFDLCLLLK